MSIYLDTLKSQKERKEEREKEKKTSPNQLPAIANSN